MKISFFSQVIFSMFIFSCTQISQNEKELRKVINTPLCVKQFDTVLHKNSMLTFQEVKEMYDYMYITYLQNGCRPCYPHFIEWQQKMDSLIADDNCTLMFVIEGDNYAEFMTHVLDIQYVEDKFYVIMDPEGEFLEQNKDIPRWIIDAGILIDVENKIKMVGAPWVNKDMTELFYKTVNSEQLSVSNDQSAIINEK